MKFLIHSNGPSLPTGYGVQTALLARRLRDAGHEVAISAYCGQAHGTGLWEGIRVYPAGFDAIGNDVLHQHAAHWFDNDPTQGWIITLTDVWGIVNPLLAEWKVAAWTPVDHFPTPPQVIDFFRRTGAVPIAMAQDGLKQLRAAGLDPLYAPLAVDTDIYKPTPHLEVNGSKVTGRTLMDIGDDKFVVMMNGMNKGWSAGGRKSFPEAMLAFAKFAKNHTDAVLYMHTESLGGGGGYDLEKLRVLCGIGDHQIVWCNQYAYRLGIPPEMLAATYTAADVLLAPSRGEGFGVPLIEAQACGTPVIVTDFTAQPELVGAGWKVHGQPEYDPTQEAFYIKADIEGISQALEAAYEAKGSANIAEVAVEFASNYDADRVFADCWGPILERLDWKPARPDCDRSDRMSAVDVIVPVMGRPGNVKPLLDSFNAANDGTANLWFVCDADDTAELEAVKANGGTYLISDRGETFAQKANSALAQTTAPWIFLCGDDVEFYPGWIDAARSKADVFDVIGTSDHPDPEQGNAPVQTGQHSDHVFVRRSYIDELGASLDGPGTVCHEGYKHYFVDYELVKLAQVRGVFTPCLESVVQHHRIGRSDATYEKGAASFERDGKTWRRRVALIEQHRQTKP